MSTTYATPPRAGNALLSFNNKVSFSCVRFKLSIVCQHCMPSDGRLFPVCGAFGVDDSLYSNRVNKGGSLQALDDVPLLTPFMGPAGAIVGPLLSQVSPVP